MNDYRDLFPKFNLGTYLDYAATAPVFLSVLDAMREYELGGRGNPRRGLHAYAERGTEALENARATVAKFIGADPSRTIFTKSATEGLNLAIASFTRDLGPGDVVVHTVFDHNSAYLPLKRASDERGFKLVEIGRDDVMRGNFCGRRGLNPVLAIIPHVSNVTGDVLPIREICERAHEVGARVIVDGAQAVAHMSVDMVELGADAYAFSAHKMYGPMGIGAVAFSAEAFRVVEPLIVGGGMVEPGIAMLEAGTPNVTGAVGFARACEELSRIGFASIQEHEGEMMRMLGERLASSPWAVSHSDPERSRRGRVRPSPVKVGSFALAQDGDWNRASSLVSFSVPGIHPHDVAQVLADQGVAVRAGHHCAPHISRLLDPAGVVRVSIGLPTTTNDVEHFFRALGEVKKLHKSLI
ncbi:MAG: aminotransferase class V-fold PLP-dependent enzyme [Patescibacteria group bacterium]